MLTYPWNAFFSPYNPSALGIKELLLPIPGSQSVSRYHYDYYYVSAGGGPFTLIGYEQPPKSHFQSVYIYSFLKSTARGDLSWEAVVYIGYGRQY